MFTATYSTALGQFHSGDTDKLLRGDLGRRLKGQVQLILTSPPFPLNRKKSYGNHQGEKYKQWLAELAPTFADLLREDGSIVIELGNGWEPGRPVQSLLTMESLLAFVNHADANLRLCQQFICHNPARLPSPAEWVTVRRIRVTDSFTNIWWIAKSDFPKADNTKVLRPYSSAMKALLKRQAYNAGGRPSGYHISQTGFLSDKGGSIMQNVVEVEPIAPGSTTRLPNVFSFSNTNSNDSFLTKCRKDNITPHPARMPTGLAAFFIQFLTDPDDLVLDPFAGSNTTGFAAELLGRRWVSVEMEREYAAQSILRFEDPRLKTVTEVGEDAP